MDLKLWLENNKAYIRGASFVMATLVLGYMVFAVNQWTSSEYGKQFSATDLKLCAAILPSEKACLNQSLTPVVDCKNYSFGQKAYAT